MINKGDFEDHWRFRAARERERLYLAAEQGDYVLEACSATSLETNRPLLRLVRLSPAEGRRRGHTA
jgi:hypothetical protein